MKQYGVAVIGNGFDLYYNQPTRYDDFYNVIRDIKTMEIEDFQQKYSGFRTVSNFYNNTKSILETNFFFKYFLSYNQTYECWNAFESELLSILEMLDNLLSEIENNDYVAFIGKEKKVYVPITYSKNYSKLLDILDECKYYKFQKEYVVGVEQSKLYLNVTLTKYNDLYMKDKIKNFIDIFPKELYKELLEFCDVFSDYIEEFVNVPSIKKLNLDISVYKIINYNYTNLAEKLFQTDNCFYIHGAISKNRNIVFGVDSSNQKLKRFYYFYKRVQRVSRGTDCDKLNNALWNKDRIVIVGHSLDSADDDSLKMILSSNYNYSLITVYYYKRNEFAIAELTNNLIRILGDKKYDSLYTQGKIEFKPLEE